MQRPPRARRTKSNITPVRPGNYRVLISNLPKTFTWRDIKDTFRKAGDIAYTEVEMDRDGKNLGYGVIDFTERQAARQAIEEFDGLYLHGGRIRLCEEKRTDDESYPTHSRYKSPSPPSTRYISHSTEDRETISSHPVVHPEGDRTVVVTNINPQTTHQAFKEYFSQYGIVTHSDLSIPSDSRQNGKGYVVFLTPYQAIYACAYADQQILFDERLTVSLAEGSVLCQYLENLDVRSYGGITPSFFCRLRKWVDNTQAYQRTGDIISALRELVDNMTFSRSSHSKTNDHDHYSQGSEAALLSFSSRKSHDLMSPYPTRRNDDVDRLPSQRDQDYDCYQCPDYRNQNSVYNQERDWSDSQRSKHTQRSPQLSQSYSYPDASNSRMPSRSQPYPSNKSEPTRLYVKNLPSNASWQDLKDHFRDNFTSDKVSHVAILPPEDRSTSASAFVYYDNVQILPHVAKRLDSTYFKGKPIVVSIDYESSHW